MPLSFLDELKLLILQQGVPPQVITGAVAAGEELSTLVRTAIDRNVAEEIRAKAETADLLYRMSRNPDLAEHAESLGGMALQLLVEVESIVSGDDDGPPDDDGEPALRSVPGGPAAA